MSAVVFGLNVNSFNPRNDFRASVDETGLVTATMSFSIRRGDYNNVRNFLLVGTRLGTLYPKNDIYFKDLRLQSHEYAQNDGANGIDVVTASFAGFIETINLPNSEKTKVYEITSSLAEISMLQHPKYLKAALQATYTDGVAVSALYNGTARYDINSSGDIKIFDNYTGQQIADITHSVIKPWFELIIVRDNKTYKSPVSEYTETQTNYAGLTDDNINYLGYIDANPPANPPTATNMIWQLTAINQQKSSDNPITWSRTWSTIEDTADNHLIYARP